MKLLSNLIDKEVFMYDNTIDLLRLNHIKHIIETIETRTQDDTLIIELRLQKQPIKCPLCSSDEIRFHSYKYRNITYSISTEYRCIIRFHQRKYQCKLCRRTFLEQNPLTLKNQSISFFTKMKILEYLKDYNRTFTDAAKLYNVSIQEVINIFDLSIDSKRRPLSDVVCIDEVFTAKMNKYKYACVLFDFNQSKIIDVLATRHKHYLVEYFARIPYEERKRVKVFVMDMWDSYREAVKLAFPNTAIAVDSFHIIRTLNDVIKRVRIDTMNKYYRNKSAPEYEDSYYYMLKKFHYFFTKNYEDIFNGPIRVVKFGTYWYKSDIMAYLLKIDEQLTSAYRLKERYREFNLTADYYHCDDDLNDLIEQFRNHSIAGLRAFGKTLINWKDEIKNSFLVFNKRRVSNGPIESTNSKIKTIIKTANGIRKFTRLRNRIMYSVNKDIIIQNK